MYCERSNTSRDYCANETVRDRVWNCGSDAENVRDVSNTIAGARGGSMSAAPSPQGILSTAPRGTARRWLSRTVAILYGSPQGVLRFRTVGSCSSERRVGPDSPLGAPKSQEENGICSESGTSQQAQRQVQQLPRVGGAGPGVTLRSSKLEATIWQLGLLVQTATEIRVA